MPTGLKVLMAIFGAVIMLIILFVLFPMILTGVDTVNSTTNASQYYGLLEITNLSPALIFFALVFIIIGTVWVFREPIKRRFFGD